VCILPGARLWSPSPVWPDDGSLLLLLLLLLLLPPAAVVLYQRVEAAPADLKLTDVKSMLQTFKAAYGQHE